MVGFDDGFLEHFCVRFIQYNGLGNDGANCGEGGGVGIMRGLRIVRYEK